MNVTEEKWLRTQDFERSEIKENYPKVLEIDTEHLSGMIETKMSLMYARYLPPNHIKIINRLPEITDFIRYKEFEKGKKMDKLTIENLNKENEELRRLLDEKYSAKELFIWSFIISVASGLSLLGWLTLNIKLINPILSVPILVGGIGFSCLSYWRMK